MEAWKQLTGAAKSIKKGSYIIILGAHSKVPVEHLYLDIESINMTQTLSVTRIIYFLTILHRPERELIRYIYQEMKAEPIKDDWKDL